MIEYKHWTHLIYKAIWCILTRSDYKEKWHGWLSLAPVELDDKRVESYSDEEGREEDEPDNVVDSIVVGEVGLEHFLGNVATSSQAGIVGVIPEKDHDGGLRGFISYYRGGIMLGITVLR